ncbi:aldo/keto reductase [Arthrobacter crusticola]|uniref:Aldo/keto reductase n=2 Tax=Arthrobacter crusticola TaxID=2547960 RepID=A0A4R5U2W8_9MICC|nr:aldo/keto reductase [Arthrobacter crusticola]
MGLGGNWTDEPYGESDIDQAETAIRAAAEAGITVFDHADIYRRGKSEAVFGEVIRRNPGLLNGATVQTKCGIVLPSGDRGGYYDLSGESVLAGLEGSLQRLQLEAVDILLLHRPDPLLDPRTLKPALHHLLQEGKIRALGVSNMSAAQMDYLQTELDIPIAVNQLEMSLSKRDWVESTVLVNHPAGAGTNFPHGTIEWCRRNGTRLQAWGALAQGLYSQPRESHTPAEGHATDLVRQLAAERSTSPEAIVLAWLLKHPARIEAVIGSTNPERIRASADASRQAELMTTSEWYALWTAARGTPLP